MGLILYIYKQAGQSEGGEGLAEEAGGVMGSRGDRAGSWERDGGTPGEEYAWGVSELLILGVFEYLLWGVFEVFLGCY